MGKEPIKWKIKNLTVFELKGLENLEFGSYSDYSTWSREQNSL